MNEHEGWSQSKLLAHVEYLELRIDDLADALTDLGVPVNRNDQTEVIERAISTLRSQADFMKGALR